MRCATVVACIVGTDDLNLAIDLQELFSFSILLLFTITNCVTAAAFYPLLLHVTMQFSIYLHPAYVDIIL
jgi:hypothetical protein